MLLHRLIAEETGGSIGVRYETLLESALENVFSGFGGQEFYPTREEKGARLGYALISNHAFVDGNKRISMYVMLTFLEVNGIRLDCANDEVVEVGLAVASSFDPERNWSGQGRTETTENPPNVCKDPASGHLLQVHRSYQPEGRGRLQGGSCQSEKDRDREPACLVKTSG